MTFPTAEDIDIMEADEYYWCDDSVIVGINAKNKKEGNEIKQQILSEHEIVERLKVEINDIECNYDIGSDEILNLLKSILENKPQ